MPKSNDPIPEILAEATTSNRRSLIKNLALATAAVGAASTIGAPKAEAAGPNPIDVVQFALNLEYLEAEFYTIATTGKTIDALGIGITGVGKTGPTTTKYGQVDFSNSTIFTGDIAMRIAADERDHVQLLRATLKSYGITPVAKPPINLDVLAANGASLQSMSSFLVLARIFEDIGVTAYAGGATALASIPTVLFYAARILAVESEHVANIRLQIAKLGISTFAIDGADVIPPPSGSNYFSTNTANGLIATRSPGEVLYLAYGAANVGKGGFFPEGVNGRLNFSSTPASAAMLA